MRTLWQDFRFGMRMLLKNPGFSTIAVVTLALGIGANTAIFSMVDAVLLRPLPYPEADRLVYLWSTLKSQGILNSGMALAVAGVALGVVSAWLLTRWMATMLFEVRATDPLTFASIALLLLGVALIACYIPARRAAKVDPMMALKYE
jgi:hypothetical protein